MQKILITAIVTLGMAGGAFAATGNGNSGAAKNMASVLSSASGTGAAAPSVSGKNAIDGMRSDSGWGNAGSRVVAGEQVSVGSK